MIWALAMRRASGGELPMPLQRLLIEREAAGMRLDQFLARYVTASADPSGLSRSGIQRLIVAGQVTLNGQRAKSSARLKVNDLIEIEDIPPREIPLKPEPLPLEILYEDHDCLVINKAAGLVVHPAAGRTQGTLVNALLHHCPDLQAVGGERRPGIVHRLDKDTSGAMIVAKNTPAFHRLARQFSERSVNKEYLGLVWGKLAPEQGLIDRPVGRHRSDRKRMSSVHFFRTRMALTEWSVERYFLIRHEGNGSRWLTWVRLKPRTGRTHQIRVHLADLKYPLVGDKIYGRSRKNPTYPSSADAFPRQALHAERLTIDHPRTGQRMNFFAPLADDLQNLLTDLHAQCIAVEAVRG
jgi:23S rRNA pseudouridine1911/1915/1917 synthase